MVGAALEWSHQPWVIAYVDRTRSEFLPIDFREIIPPVILL